jgi:small GTP-binding protein
MAKNICYDDSFKFILLGDQYVGKSSLVNLLMNNDVSNDYKCTIGIEFSSKIISLTNNINIKCLIWDTAGQERYRTITNTYYKGSDGVIIIFDCTSRKTFDNCYHWLNEAIDRLDLEKCVVYLIGNKSDLVDHRVVFNEDIATIIEEYSEKIPHFKYFECSMLNSSDEERNIFKNMCNELYISKGHNKFICHNQDDDIIILENFREEPKSTCC